jgi:cell division protein FtsL
VTARRWPLRRRRPRPAAVRPRRGGAGEDRRLGLTRRGLVLLVVVFGLTTMAIWPLRQYVTQQQRIDQLQAKQAALAAEVDRLEAERERLQDPEYVEQLAREDLHMARPGEEPWVLTGPPPADRPQPAAPEPAQRPWYQRFWDALLGRSG